MVKNSIGGNKAKKQGRKHVATSNATNKLRIAIEEGELYAYISKIYGNGMCCALGIDNKEYLCHIRNKFRGRSKRDNTIIIGSWVLIGLREWEGDKAKKSCDLLEIYAEHEIEQLKNRVFMNWSIFPSNNFGGSSNTNFGIGEDELKFSENIDDTKSLIKKDIFNNFENNKNDIITEDNIVDFDDI